MEKLWPSGLSSSLTMWTDINASGKQEPSDAVGETCLVGVAQWAENATFLSVWGSSALIGEKTKALAGV